MTDQDRHIETRKRAIQATVEMIEFAQSAYSKKRSGDLKGYQQSVEIFKTLYRKEPALTPDGQPRRATITHEEIPRDWGQTTLSRWVYFGDPYPPEPEDMDERRARAREIHERIERALEGISVPLERKPEFLSDEMLQWVVGQRKEQFRLMAPAVYMNQKANPHEAIEDLAKLDPKEVEQKIMARLPLKQEEDGAFRHQFPPLVDWDRLQIKKESSMVWRKPGMR
ncbi:MULTISPECIES: hypothetical protein [unclassified Thioalkalivibrio]|uniref:hypothetical protein n=1 Tax=unclassified Thioalkalivibrio TaxID=2621013 RepID=UPI0003802ED3|nr:MULTISPECIES: hypothetical protein [unclassified Thioalkalivibrio]